MKTIFYELNEVPKRLFEFFAAAKPQSSFARLKNHASLFETVAQDIGALSPWITWPSLHRGVSNVDHKISDLGQNMERVDQDFPPIWKLLAGQGVSVGVFGSLHSYPMPQQLDGYQFYVPDTFAAGPECFPDELTEFQRFNLSMVKKNGRNVSSGIAMDSAARFLTVAPGLGLRGKTIAKLAKQLVAERINSKRVVRRRTSQVEIAFDFFLKQLNSKQPDASFFFTNHVASSMHRYWPAIFPQDYEAGRFDATWLAEWNKEIPHAVHVANSQLAELMQFVDRNPAYRLVVLSSMGQAAVKEATLIQKQILITDIERLLSYLGIRRDQWEPRLSMAPQVVVAIKDAELISKLTQLSTIHINDHRINFKVLETGDIRFEIHAPNQDTLQVRDHEGRCIDPEVLGISNVDLQDAAGANAYHVPEGILIEYQASSQQVNPTNAWQVVSALDVAPSVLHSFGIAVPQHMQGDKQLFVQ